jgi:hypothetical protein
MIKGEYHENAHTIVDRTMYTIPIR